VNAGEERRSLVQQIHAGPGLGVLALTGGGSLAISDLLAEPGASRTVLEAVVPYAGAALIDWVGGAPDQFCSATTARAMAMAGFRRAQALAADAPGQPLFGLGCTASLASDRPKRGEHRAHLALQTAASTHTRSIVLTKGLRSRLEEERLIADLALNLVAEACEVKARITCALHATETIENDSTNAPPAWQRLLAGETPAIRRNSGDASWEELEAHAPRPQVQAIFSGAFNPLHDGHRQMARVAAEELGCPIEYEISIENVDKPPLNFTELATRAEQFRDVPLWLTREKTFAGKIRLFPGAVFVIGADTLERIGQARYYGGEAALDRALEELRSAGARFLVFGRLVKGEFVGLDEMILPPALRALCQGVPEERYRQDISSTELRRQASDD